MINEVEIENRLTRVEERSKSNTHQIEDLKPVINEIHTMSRTLATMVEQLKNMAENVGNLNNKVDAIEAQPNKRIEQIKTAIITALCTALISGVVAAIIFNT